MMTMLLLAVIGSTWAGNVTISPTQALNEGGVSPITTVCEKGDGTSAPAISSGQLRLYQAASGKTTGNTITFSSENTITSIVFTFYSNYTADNGSFSNGSYDSSTSTWSGSTNSVTLTVTGTTSGKRIYITNMVVYYADNSSLTVTYDANGGSGTVPVDNTEYESEATVTVLGGGNLSKTGYSFAGWNTSANGSGTPYNEGNTFSITTNTVLYAQWNANTNNVTLPSADQYGTYGMNATNPVAYGTEVTLTYTPAEGYENYVATWSVNGEPITGNKFTMPDENVTVTVSLEEVTQESWIIDFESATSAYPNWTFSNISSNYSNSGVTAHGGSKYGSTQNTSGSIQTKEKIAKPVSLTCYVTKQTTNQTASTWYIQVSSDGNNWIDIADISASSMTKGDWKTLTGSLAGYSDVYVRVYYSGTNAVRLIDDLTLVIDKAAVPTHELTFYANGEIISTDTKGEGEIITFPTDPADVGDFKFVGWTTDEIDGVTDERPVILNTSSTPMATDDMSIYAVFANQSGEGAKWKRVESKNVGAGVYAIVNSLSDKPFNGSLSGGDALLTTDAFVFESDGYAYTTPEGTCELTLAQSGDGYSMYNADHGYLYVKTKTSRGNIAWHETEDSYWSYSSNNWGYLVTDLTEPATSVLQCMGFDDIRNYAANSTYTPVYFAQKETTQAYSNYCTIVGNFEIIDFATDGYKTYVTKNPIDWVATLERNNSDIDVHGYKAIAFSEADGVSLVEFGVENLESVAETDPMYQEPITPAQTPMVIMGKQGKNYLVISPVTTASAPTGNLFRKGDGVATTTLKEDGEPDVALYVMQKIDVNGSGIDNYKFYRLRPGYTVPEGKAYLSSEDITMDPQTPPNVNNIKSSYPMRVLEQEDEQLVSEDAGIVDGIGMNYQEGKDNVYYNVNGMRIANPSKGIYIVNGRKVVLK
jgi:uncharacterized repeat protein (TIGR02543 family)